MAAKKNTQDIARIGGRLEPFVDDWLIERLRGAELRLHSPVERNVALTFDRPWEGDTSAYVTVFQDGGLFRMYYRGSSSQDGMKHQVTCYAESRDGVEWMRPDLGHVEFNGSRANNIVWDGYGRHNFTPFRDTNPACDPRQRYKALGGDMKVGLNAFVSEDGLKWSMLRETPVFTDGAFDSQNLAFWDAERGCYVMYFRVFVGKVRCISVCTSKDFVKWSRPKPLTYGDAPDEQLYTNAVTPYFRAPHIYLGFPKRFVIDRKVVEEPRSGVSDGLFMSSRDGVAWKRWGEAFIRPGLLRERWINRNNMPAWGLLKTSGGPGMPDEISLFASEAYYTPGCRLRRFSVRMDGFVSVHAGLKGGQMVTRPMSFKGRELVMNFSTSAAGSVRVEMQNEAGKPLPGRALKDCAEIYGDNIEQVVRWADGSDVSRFAAKRLRLRFVLKDADLYAIRFR